MVVSFDEFQIGVIVNVRVHWWTCRIKSELVKIAALNSANSKFNCHAYENHSHKILYSLNLKQVLSKLHLQCCHLNKDKIISLAAKMNLILLIALDLCSFSSVAESWCQQNDIRFDKDRPEKGTVIHWLKIEILTDSHRNSLNVYLSLLRIQLIEMRSKFVSAKRFGADGYQAEMLNRIQITNWIEIRFPKRYNPYISYKWNNKCHTEVYVEINCFSSHSNMRKQSRSKP